MFRAIKSIVAGIKGGSAQASYMKGNYQRALTQINSAISLDRDAASNPFYMALKGKCLYHLNEKDKAKTFLVTAEALLVSLLEQDDQGHILSELTKVKGFIEKCA